MITPEQLEAILRPHLETELDVVSIRVSSADEHRYRHVPVVEIIVTEPNPANSAIYVGLHRACTSLRRELKAELSAGYFGCDTPGRDLQPGLALIELDDLPFVLVAS